MKRQKVETSGEPRAKLPGRLGRLRAVMEFHGTMSLVPQVAALDTLAKAATKAGLAPSALKATRQWLVKQLV